MTNNPWIKTPNGWLDLPIGNWLVWLDYCSPGGTNVAVASVHKTQNSKLAAINGDFAFDADNVLAYKAIETEDYQP